MLCFIYKFKQNLDLPVFPNNFTHKTKTKYSLRNSVQKPLCQTNFSRHLFISVDVTLGAK